MPRAWTPGDRVTRELFMDNGVWNEWGDTCLAHSPLRHVVVQATELVDNRGTVLFRVRWDDGEIRRYFGHGIDRETPTLETD